MTSGRRLRWSFNGTFVYKGSYNLVVFVIGMDKVSCIFFDMWQVNDVLDEEDEKISFYKVFI